MGQALSFATSFINSPTGRVTKVNRLGVLDISGVSPLESTVDVIGWLG
jgi:hypothetical protein